MRWLDDSDFSDPYQLPDRIGDFESSNLISEDMEM